MRSSAIAARAFHEGGQLTVVPTNTEVAQQLLENRTLMELAGESFYKYSAYEKAAASIENAPPFRSRCRRGIERRRRRQAVAGALDQPFIRHLRSLEELYLRYRGPDGGPARQ